ncbi:MAG: hypothetical protein HXO68_03945 [Rothia sp.]|uniref:hypothetical protein n=1 Tax=Rothia sp. (in: high G+C Gram-positive bacteria) TaxID=1885016 RepID=UPI001CB23B39|nr:hypothetical protein [Rothia sp. (in: high G+C Gram-positive bacteria)]MBF1676279.1 hypothetical protein [Rothia sp. (in: high G+C Gram-positive bacteria)]
MLFSVPKASQPRFAWPALAPPRAPSRLVPEALYEEQVADEPKRLQVAETR